MILIYCMGWKYHKPQAASIPRVPGALVVESAIAVGRWLTGHRDPQAGARDMESDPKPYTPGVSQLSSVPEKHRISASRALFPHESPTQRDKDVTPVHPPVMSRE